MWQDVNKALAVAFASLLAWFCSTAHGFQEPRGRSACEVAGMRRFASSAHASPPSLSTEGLILRLRTPLDQIDYRIASGPILDPLYDSLSGRIFWISHEDVCEVRVGSSQGRSVYQERGFSGIGRMWLARDTLMIHGGNRDSCTAIRMRNHGDILAKVVCPDPRENTMKVIQFYSANDEYGEFSNFALYPGSVDEPEHSSCSRNSLENR